MLKYNITEKDGERESVTLFLGRGDTLVATKGHAQFDSICDTLTHPLITDEQELISFLRDKFDASSMIANAFGPLSERVSVANGRLFFDGDEAHSSIAKTIVEFMAQDNTDVLPLVKFMEKIATNPNEHSRDNLFGWLELHDFAICDDGDFVAYKGLGVDDLSIHAGTAMVNGTVIQGKIPNLPNTVIEMPRSKVQFDPGVGCSTGLHVANWRYASDWGPKRVQVKVNPRDVVSVPTDSDFEKMRVCRYKVLGVVDAEDRSRLYVGEVRTAHFNQAQDFTVPTAKPAKAAAFAPERWAPIPLKGDGVFPTYYEDFHKKHFNAMTATELRWLAKEWEIAGARRQPITDLVERLTKMAAKFRREGLDRR